MQIFVCKSKISWLVFCRLFLIHINCKLRNCNQFWINRFGLMSNHFLTCNYVTNQPIYHKIGIIIGLVKVGSVLPKEQKPSNHTSNNKHSHKLFSSTSHCWIVQNSVEVFFVSRGHLVTKKSRTFQIAGSSFWTKIWELCRVYGNTLSYPILFPGQWMAPHLSPCSFRILTIWLKNIPC